MHCDFNNPWLFWGKKVKKYKHKHIGYGQTNDGVSAATGNWSKKNIALQL